MAKSAPRRRRTATPLDSLPERIEPDEVLPDDLHRIDEPDEVPEPASTREAQRVIEGVTSVPDGGVSQHPIHDEDLEDLGPDDYQKQIDGRGRSGETPPQ
jgi:hypothetical protein